MKFKSNSKQKKSTNSTMEVITGKRNEYGVAVWAPTYMTDELRWATGGRVNFSKAANGRKGPKGRGEGELQTV